MSRDAETDNLPQDPVITRLSATSGQKHVELTIRLTRDDAERLVQDFREGKLAGLGVLDIQQVADSSQKQWAAPSEKGSISRGDDSAAKHKPPSR